MPALPVPPEEADQEMDTTSKTPQGAHATDRVVEALATLAALLDRTINEVKLLDSDFQNRLLQAVHDTEAAMQSQAASHLDTTLAESRSKLEAQFKNKLEEISSEWEAERTRLNDQINRLTQAATQWEAERLRLTAEVERLARVQAATQAEAEKALAAAKAARVSTATSATSDAETITKEMERINGRVKEITALIDDPATELSTVIRKNVERSELESYLKGLRFALNGAGLK
jgi:chromosome segregation ATPase